MKLRYRLAVAMGVLVCLLALPGVSLAAHKKVFAHAAWAGMPNGCQLHSVLNLNDGSLDRYQGNGWIVCPDTFWGPNNQHLNVQSVTQQLVSGGWQNVGFTMLGPAYPYPQLGYGAQLGPWQNAPLIRLTCGRWYRQWTWGDENGYQLTYVTQSVQGGGSGCL